MTSLSVAPIPVNPMETTTIMGLYRVYGHIRIMEKKMETTITWAPKVCKIMAFWAIIMGLGPSFYILLGVRVITFEGIRKALPYLAAGKISRGPLAPSFPRV